MKLAIFASHPIQYLVPIWRRLANQPGLEIKVLYFSDHSIRGGIDPEFGVPVAWDQPLLEGYPHEFLSKDADLSNTRNVLLKEPVRLLRSGGFDAVLLMGYTFGFERQVATHAKALGVRVVLRGELREDRGRRFSFRRLARTLYLKWFYSKVDAFCLIGGAARVHLRSYGIPERKQYNSPYSVDTEMLDAQKALHDRGSIRQGLNVGNSFVILFSGKLIERKQPLSIVSAIQKLKHPDGVYLLVIGDGPLRDDLCHKARQVLGNRFHIAGFVNQGDLAKYFLAADALVLPSSYETWGLVVNEAMQFSLPVIVSDQVGCHSDLVTKDQTGFVFEAGNARALADCLERLISDPAKAREMGAHGFARIKSYSPDAAAQGIIQALGL